MIKAKIDLAKIHKAKLLQKDGRTFLEITHCQLFEGRNGARYLDLALFETPNSQYGDDWRISQDLPKAMRDAGEKGPIIGNGKNRESGARKAAPQPETTTTTTMNDEDVPF